MLRAHPSRVDLVVSDVMMPEMDGFELLEQIHSDEIMSDVPIILLTSLSEDLHRLKALRIGVNDYLGKPFVGSRLLRHCDRVLGRAKARQGSASGIEGEVLHHLAEVMNNDLFQAQPDISSITDVLQKSIEELEEIVKRTTGFTMEEYYRELKLQYARIQIETQNYTCIEALATQLGYTDTDPFIKDFEDRYGIVPRDLEV